MQKSKRLYNLQLVENLYLLFLLIISTYCCLFSYSAFALIQFQRCYRCYYCYIVVIL